MLRQLICRWGCCGQGDQELAGVLGLVGQQMQGRGRCSPIQVLHLLLILVGMRVLQASSQQSPLQTCPMHVHHPWWQNGLCTSLS